MLSPRKLQNRGTSVIHFYQFLMASEDEAVIKQEPESSSHSRCKRMAEKGLEGQFSDKQIHTRSLAVHIIEKAPLIDLALDVQYMILSKLPYEDLFRAKLICKWFNDHISNHDFHNFRGKMHPQELSLTALHFSSGKDGLWQCAGYDLMSTSWKKLPPFGMLPCLDPKLFKDHSICGAGGIMCANVSTSSSSKGKMIVFNPLTRRCKELPPLNHPRNPVLMQIVVDSTRQSYKVIVAGSARQDQEHLSKTTEVYDSTAGTWAVAQNLPGPPFALNEHQTGVYRNGILYCIAFVEEGEDTKQGVVAFDVEEAKWVPALSCPLPCPTNLNIVQLVDRPGEDIVLFSEVETSRLSRSVEQRIDILEDVVVTSTGQGRGKWRNVMSETKAGSQAGLQVYPQHACVPFGEGKVCVFDTIVSSGIVYDVESGERGEALPSPTFGGSSREMKFYSMNPVTFSFEASLKGCNP